MQRRVDKLIEQARGIARERRRRKFGDDPPAWIDRWAAIVKKIDDRMGAIVYEVPDTEPEGELDRVLLAFGPDHFRSAFWCAKQQATTEAEATEAFAVLPRVLEAAPQELRFAFIKLLATDHEQKMHRGVRRWLDVLQRHGIPVGMDNEALGQIVRVLVEHHDEVETNVPRCDACGLAWPQRKQPPLVYTGAEVMARDALRNQAPAEFARRYGPRPQFFPACPHCGGTKNGFNFHRGLA